MTDPNAPSSGEPLSAVPASRGPYYPPYPPYPPPPTAKGSGCLRAMFLLFLFGSLLLNLILFIALAGTEAGTSNGASISEKTYSGSGTNKIAVVRVETVLMEGMLSYVHKQIDKAARDDKVKAVVLRIESPGGTITASEDLHRRLSELRDGNSPRFRSNAKPLVVSMGAIAASGGYYIAMPAGAAGKPDDPRIFAEKTTLTGSIGVYASFLDLSGFGKQYGIGMQMIKAGDVKGSGGMFAEMSPQERQPWQDMVDQAYQQFQNVVAAGRPALKGKLTEDLFPPRPVPRFDKKGNPLPEKAGEPVEKYTRKRADGGVFTAEDALQYGLIDQIGTLDDAVAQARKLAGLADARVVQYDKPPSLSTLLLGEARTGSSGIDSAGLSGAATPRLWYLIPGGEAAGVLAASFGR